MVYVMTAVALCMIFIAITYVTVKISLGICLLSFVHYLEIEGYGKFDEQKLLECVQWAKKEFNGGVKKSH